MRNTAARDGRLHQCSTTGKGGLATAAATYSWDNDEDKAVNSCTIQRQRPVLAHVETARLVLVCGHWAAQVAVERQGGYRDMTD